MYKIKTNALTIYIESLLYNLKCNNFICRVPALQGIFLKPNQKFLLENDMSEIYEVCEVVSKMHCIDYYIVRFKVLSEGHDNLRKISKYGEMGE